MADTDCVLLVAIGGMVSMSRDTASVVLYHFTSAVCVPLDYASQNGESGSMRQMRSGRHMSCKNAEWDSSFHTMIVDVSPKYHGAGVA